jgi:sarcosine oxidase, subunit beta
VQNGRARRRTADVAVIGGGIIGASIAWHLASRGCTNIVIVDGGVARGSGSTSKATGGFRAQFASAVNIRLSLLSRQKLLQFEEDTRTDPGFEQRGYLWVAGDERSLAALREAQRLQHELGLTEARMLSTAEVLDVNPAVDPLGVAGGAFCPSDGYIRPMQMLEGYLSDACRRGVEVRFNERVVGLERDEESVRTIVTSRGAIDAGVVVNAAGAWAGSIAGMAGVGLPVTPLRRSVAVTAPTALLPPDMPMTIFTADGFHLRPRDGRVLLLLPEIPRDDPFDDSRDESWLAGVAEIARRRIPALSGVPIDRDLCWSGLYEMSPDHHAIVGRAPQTSNFYLANGSSGHGVMHAPALGQILSEMILDGKASIDVEALRPERFAEGRPNQVSGLL